MKFLKTLISILLIPFGIKGEVTKEAVENGYCNFEGQGKNKFGE